jgi:hypothetical protein
LPAEAHLIRRKIHDVEIFYKDFLGQLLLQAGSLQVVPGAKRECRRRKTASSQRNTDRQQDWKLTGEG